LIRPVPVPWLIGPRGIEVVSDEDAVFVTFASARHPGPARPCKVILRVSSWSTVTVALPDGDPLPYRLAPPASGGRGQRSISSPSGLYEVVGSDWHALPPAGAVRHYLIRSRRFFAEFLAERVVWRWSAVDPPIRSGWQEVGDASTP